MKNQNRLFLPALFLIALFFAACREPAVQDAASPPPTGPLSVYVVNYPLQYFAERIGGDHVQVHFPAPVDVDPAEWNPDDETILQYQQADLILLNGARYAAWIGQVTLPVAAMVNTAQHIRDRLIEVPDAITHSHGPEGAHSHAGAAFTTWLDLLLAIEHARAIKDALSERLPAHSGAFEENFQALAVDYEALDREIDEIVSQNPDQPLLASHPVYQYLEARYSLHLESLHWEPDEMPSPSEWEALKETLEAHPAQWILWEDEPLAEIVSRLEDLGVNSIVYNPGSQPPETGDLLTVMHQNAANLDTAFTGE
ncbi:MAG: metal ABC transporter substrate-binding protein [Opitutales bacterium]